MGEDIAFELALIEKFGLTVHGFDPTPRSLAWIQRQRLPERFRFHPIGLHQTDGQLVFYPPRNPAHVSFSISKEGHSERGVTLEVKRLASIMRELQHQQIDLLKMDIEGSEYGVIDDLTESKHRIGQLLVEFHDRMPGFTVHQTGEAVEKLRGLGYRLFDVSPAGHELGFIHREVLPMNEGRRV